MNSAKRVYVTTAVVALVSCSLLGSAGTASAAELSMGKVYTLESAASSSENMYIAAEQITLDGTVFGDALLLGENIAISGTTTEDLLIAGKEVTLSGTVLGDARLIAARAHIGGTYGGDVMVVANSARFQSSFHGDGDTRVYAPHLIFRGINTGDITLRGRTVEINGTIKGNVVVAYSEFLTIGDEARISGSVLYEGPRAPRVSPGAVIEGELDGEIVSGSGRSDLYGAEFADIARGAQVIVALSATFASVLLVLLFPRFSHRTIRYVVRRGVPSIGYGFLLLFFGLILAVALLASVVGMYLGILWLFGFATILLLASLLTPVLAGALIAQWVTKEYRVTWYWVIAGVIVLELVLWIPVVGPVVRILMYLAVLGSLARGMYDMWWTRRRQDGLA